MRHSFLFLLAAPALTFPAAAAQKAGGQCQLIRLLPDGREVRSMVKDEAGTVRAGRNGASAVAPSSGANASSVSVSSSSSSSSRGGTRARARTSHSDASGRTVTTTRTMKGCTIVIDERDAEGE